MVLVVLVVLVVLASLSSSPRSSSDISENSFSLRMCIHSVPDFRVYIEMNIVVVLRRRDYRFNRHLSSPAPPKLFHYSCFMLLVETYYTTERGRGGGHTIIVDSVHCYCVLRVLIHDPFARLANMFSLQLV